MFKKRSARKNQIPLAQTNSPNRLDENDDEEPLTAQEEALLAKFEENDREIDEMLEGVIDQVERLNL